MIVIDILFIVGVLWIAATLFRNLRRLERIRREQEKRFNILEEIRDTKPFDTTRWFEVTLEIEEANGKLRKGDFS